jgi:hypothetical protein
VTAEARGVRVPNTPWAAQLLVGARQQLIRAHGGAWLGAQGGAVRQVGQAWPSVAAEAGAWRRAGAGGAGGRHRGRGGGARRGARARGGRRRRVRPARVRTADLVASYARVCGRVELGAWLGTRAYGPAGLRALPADDEDPTRPGAPLRWRLLAAASATAWVAPAVGVTASAGVLPNDPVRGVPAARHLLLALRVRPWTRPPEGARAAPAVGPALYVGDAPEPAGAGAPLGPTDGAPPDGAGGVVHPGEAGEAGEARPAARRVVRVVASGAARVQLRADATGWRPVPMTRGADGAWTAALALAPGTHRVLVQVDGGPWRAPANLPAVDDDLGGRVGLLVVP